MGGTTSSVPIQHVLQNLTEEEVEAYGSIAVPTKQPRAAARVVWTAACRVALARAQWEQTHSTVLSRVRVDDAPPSGRSRAIDAFDAEMLLKRRHEVMGMREDASWVHRLPSATESDRVGRGTFGYVLSLTSAEGVKYALKVQRPARHRPHSALQDVYGSVMAQMMLTHGMSTAFPWTIRHVDVVGARADGRGVNAASLADIAPLIPADTLLKWYPESTRYIPPPLQKAWRAPLLPPPINVGEFGLVMGPMTKADRSDPHWGVSSDVRAQGHPEWFAWAKRKGINLAQSTRPRIWTRSPLVDNVLQAELARYAKAHAEAGEASAVSYTLMEYVSSTSMAQVMMWTAGGREGGWHPHWSFVRDMIGLWAQAAWALATFGTYTNRYHNDAATRNIMVRYHETPVTVVYDVEPTRKRVRIGPTHWTACVIDFGLVSPCKRWFKGAWDETSRSWDDVSQLCVDLLRVAVHADIREVPLLRAVLGWVGRLYASYATASKLTDDAQDVIAAHVREHAPTDSSEEWLWSLRSWDHYGRARAHAKPARPQGVVALEWLASSDVIHLLQGAGVPVQVVEGGYGADVEAPHAASYLYNHLPASIPNGLDNDISIASQWLWKNAALDLSFRMGTPTANAVRDTLNALLRAHGVHNERPHRLHRDDVLGKALRGMPEDSARDAMWRTWMRDMDAIREQRREDVVEGLRTLALYTTPDSGAGAGAGAGVGAGGAGVAPGPPQKARPARDAEEKEEDSTMEMQFDASE
jgi:hypothetical protein